MSQAGGCECLYWEGVNILWGNCSWLPQEPATTTPQTSTPPSTSIATLLIHASIPAQLYQSINPPCINQFIPSFLLGTAPFSTSVPQHSRCTIIHSFTNHLYLSLSLVSPSVSPDSHTCGCSANNHRGSSICHGTRFCMFTANEASCRLKGLRKCLHRYRRQSNAKCSPCTTRDMQR